MSQASLTFTLPEESHEFKAAAGSGDLQAAIQDLERLLRDKDKYGTAQDKALTAAQVRGLLREVLRDHDAEWALD